MKPDPAAPASGAEMLARYRATRARLMSPPSPAKPVEPAVPAPAAPAAAISETPTAHPVSKRPRWLAELIEFNEELRRLFVGLSESAPPILFAKQVRDAVAAHYRLTVAELVGPRATRQCARPRQIAMYICARHAGIPSPRIGALFGGRDHSTVLHAVRRVAARMAADPALAAEISALIENCRGGGSA